ncbi:Phosphoethanolamine transferase EptA [Salmonella enterica subsp. enterica serovar Newport]|nr:Phosphoethanolamine transferase EptA [Salmonella enterica subsp. enterica serovar Newport]
MYWCFSMPVVAFSVVNSVLTLASFIWLNRLLACVFILVGAAAQYFILTYGIIIDRSMIANMMDTTPAETFALMTPQMVLTLGLSGVLAAVIAFWVKIRPATPRLRSGLYRLVSVLISILLVILVAAFFYKDYASLFRNNKQLIKALSPSNSIRQLVMVFASTAGEFAAGTHWRGCPSQSINAERRSQKPDDSHRWRNLARR